MEKKSWYHDKTAEEEFAKKNCVQGISYEVENLSLCIYTPEMRGSYAIRAMKGRLKDDEAQSKKNRK